MSKMEDSKSKSLVPENAATINCQPCRFEHKDKEASGYCQDCVEYLCKECYSIHKKTKPTRNHILLDSSKMPTDQSCLDHPGNVIEYFCKIDLKLVCKFCKLSSHSACEPDLEPINDVAKNFESTLEYMDLLYRIEKRIDNYYQNIHPAAEKVIQDIKNNRETIHFEVKEFRKNINYQLDKWEKDLVNENNRKHDEIMKVVNSVDTKSKEITMDAEQLKQKLEKLLKTGNYRSHYIQARRAEMSLTNQNFMNNIREQETESDECFYLPAFTSNKEEFVKWSSQNVIGKVCDSKQQIFPFKMTSTAPMQQLFGDLAIGMQQVPTVPSSMPAFPGSMPAFQGIMQQGQPMSNAYYSMQQRPFMQQPYPYTCNMQGQPMQ